MLTFKTQFPLNSDKEVDDLFEVGRIWLAGSPYSSLADDMAHATGICDGWTKTNSNEEIKFAKFINGHQLSALRHENLDDSSVRWVTEVACSKTENDFWVSVQLSVDSELPVEKIDYGKRPHILKTIMSEIGGGLDGPLPVSDRPIYLEDNQVDLAADIITANANYVMPIVYVSVDSHNKPFINPIKLSQWLSGMAHVVVEPTRSFSFQLMPLVYGENSYGGAVAIYWPDGIGKWLFMAKNEYAEPKAMQIAIAKKVRMSLLSQRTKRECTWSYIQEQKSKQRILELKESGSDKVDDYISAFDVELKSKDEEIQRLESEINRLRYNNVSSDANSPRKSRGLSLESNESDLYQGERLSIIVDALRQAIDSTEKHSRRNNVLEDLITSNVQEGEKESILGTLKRILQSYRSMNPSTKKELERIGFEILEDGKHYKLIFRGDQRYPFILAKTGSDHRGGMNSFSEIKKRLF